MQQGVVNQMEVLKSYRKKREGEGVRANINSLTDSKCWV